MFNWPGLLKLALQLTLAFVTWQRERALLEAGAAAAIEKNLKEADDLVSTALDARARVRDRVRSDPDSVRDDDGHRRD